MQNTDLQQSIQIARDMIQAFYVEGDVDKVLSYVNPENFTWIGGNGQILTNLEEVRSYFEQNVDIVRQSYQLADEDYSSGGDSEDSCVVIAKIRLESRDKRFLSQCSIHFSFYFQNIDGKILCSSYHVHIPRYDSIVEKFLFELDNTEKKKQHDQFFGGGGQFLQLVEGGGIEIGDSIVLHLRQRQIEIEGKLINLTPVEFELLIVLLAHINQPVDPNEIYQSVWNDSELRITSNTLKMHISNLRKKLNLSSNSKIQLSFLRGQGYRLSLNKS